MHLSPGMMVSSNVRLKCAIGEGAMGCVWVAEHLTLKTDVAVKFISAQLANTDSEILARFIREASMSAQIKSPHVVQTFDQGVMVDGTPYIVMELLEGTTLQELLDREKRMSLTRASQVVSQVARALAKAHALGIVHRDIKPDNIFVTPTDEGLFAKVLDFGIAKQTQLPKMGGLTNPGVMVGTPEYMSPEQVLSARDVDYRADLWALAITGYYMLTGELPFTAEALGTLCVKLLDGSFTPASKLRADLHKGFDAFFDKALAHAPSDRFQGAREMASAFAHLCAGTTGVLAEDTLTGFTPMPGSLLVDSAPLSGPMPPSSPQVPVSAKEESQGGTLTGSSASRRLEGERRGWRAGILAAGVTAAVAVAGTLVWMSSSTSEEPEAKPAAADPVPEPLADPAPQPAAPAPAPDSRPVDTAQPDAVEPGAVEPKPAAPTPASSVPVPRNTLPPRPVASAPPPAPAPSGKKHWDHGF